MESLDDELPTPRFHVDVAQGAKGHATAGVEPVQHPLVLPVAVQFLLKGPEDVRLGRLEKEVHLVRNPAAALDAVKQWQFTPTLLNGQAVPVIMTVTVNFTLQ